MIPTNMNLNKLIIVDEQKMFTQSLTYLFKNLYHSKYFIEKVYNTVPETDLLKNFTEHIFIIDNQNLSPEFLSDLLVHFKTTKSRLIILSDNSNHNYVRKAMQNGASAYLLKSNDIQELDKALYEVNSDRTYLGTNVFVAPPTISLAKYTEGKSENIYNSRTLSNILTRREKEILRLIIQTKDNREISKELFISEQTVIVHKKNIMKKFGIRSTINLIRYTVEQGLVEIL